MTALAWAGESVLGKTERIGRPAQTDAGPANPDQEGEGGDDELALVRVYAGHCLHFGVVELILVLGSARTREALEPLDVLLAIAGPIVDAMLLDRRRSERGLSVTLAYDNSHAWTVGMHGLEGQHVQSRMSSQTFEQ